MDFSTKQNNHPSPSIWNWYVRVFIFFSFFKLSSFFFNSKFFITTYFQLFLGKWNIWSSSEIDNIFFYFLYSRLKHYSATGLMVMGWFETRQNWKYIVSNSYSAYLVTFVLRNFNVSFSKNSSIDVVLISDSSIKNTEDSSCFETISQNKKFYQLCFTAIIWIFSQTDFIDITGNVIQK